MEFEVLGPIGVQGDAGRVPLGGPKPRALLAMLVLNANRPVSRDRLMEGLWGERLPASAEHTLDDYVSRLRKALGPDRIQRRAPGYVLRVEPGEVDLERFGRLVARGREALAAGAVEPAAGTLREALALWRGPALADVLDEPFAPVEARHLEDRRLSALEDRIDADLACGGSPELIDELEQLVREQPLRERLLGQLMRALYLGGRPGEALAAFQAGRRRFAEELGLDPGPQLRRLEQQILEHDPVLQPPMRTRAAAAGAPRRGTAVSLAVAGGLLIVSVAAGLIIGIGGSSGSRTVPTAAGELVGLSRQTGAVSADVMLGGTSGAMAMGAGGLWVAVPDANEVVRSDPRTGRVVDRVPLADQPSTLAVGGGAVWAVSALGRSLSRIDPDSGRVVEKIRLGITPSSIAVTRGELWVADPGDAALLRIDARSGRVRQTVSLRFRPAALAVTRDAVWVADHDNGTVTNVDPHTNEPVATVSVGQGPTALTVGGGAVWVANSLDGTVSRIDPVVGNVTATIATESGSSDLVHAEGSIWVANTYAHSVSRIDAARARVTKTVRVTGEPTSVASAGDKLWVGIQPPAARRGGTLVLVRTDRFHSTDPQIEYEIPPAGYLGLASDGLVAWNHTSGLAGIQLVPDLALALPAPRDGGRTYVFRLRPRIRYDDGRIVRASDLVRGMARMYRVHSPGAAYFDRLVGGSACRQQPAGCRLPAGVVADDHARTVTFHLTAPDPEFLDKLAIGVVVPIPSGTPMHDVPFRPLPGTGPYKIASVGRREIRFVRNRFFREWSHAAQPDGNPDQIVWRFGMTPAQQVRAISAGRADWSDTLPEDLERVAREHGSRLHSNAFPIVSTFQINTRRPPFNDVRARRALNFAVDRRVVVRLYGGPVAATPTCQVLPPGIPGHRPYCPYTRSPRADGRWRAPDLRRARALVASSGTQGVRVTVWTVTDTKTHQPGVDYLAALLRRLGYRAHVRTISNDAIGRAPLSVRRRMQLLPITFGPDYPTANEFFGVFFACNGPYTWGQFCDPRIDRQIRRANALTQTNLSRATDIWARLDRELVDRAAWLPLINLRINELVSSRLRGYQYSPIYHFLPAQAWLR